MGIVDNSIPRLTYKNGALNAERPQPYVDDIFDPLFNAEVRRYLNDKYGGNPFVNTLGGYSELTKNALFGHKKWGILGPGMGIWSAFGRSMDKADDVILGGITEATKGITGQGFESPLENIFVKDEDYSGSRLLSAMANSFNSMSGGKIGGVTTPEDFTGVWNLPALGIDLATDPGIMGGATRRAATLKLENAIGNQTVNKTLAEVGDIMSKYDDIMANVAGNTVVPGMKFAIGKLIHQILNVVQHRVAAHWKNVTTEAAEDVAGGAADAAGGAADTAARATASPPSNIVPNTPSETPITSFRGDYDFLSNFYNAPVTYNGVTFTNAEAAFQAMKDPSRAAEFANLTPSAARHLGRTVTLRPDWESVKEQVMREVIQAKFAQNPELMERLMRTGGAQLVEGNTWGDTVWGQVNGVGENRLGNILMDLRRNNTPKPKAPVDPVAEALANDPTSSTMADMAIELDNLRKSYDEPSVDVTRINPNEVGGLEFGRPANVYDSLMSTYDSDVLFLNRLNRIRTTGTNTLATEAVSPKSAVDYARNVNAFKRTALEQLKLRSGAEDEFFDWAGSKGYTVDLNPNTAMKEIGIGEIPDDVWLRDYAPQIYDIARREATVEGVNKAIPSYTKGYWNVPGELREVAPVGELPHMEFFRTPEDILARPNIRPMYTDPKWTGATTEVFPNTTLNPTYVDDLFSIPKVSKDTYETVMPVGEFPVPVRYADGWKATSEPHVPDTATYLWDLSPEDAPELYLQYRDRLASADFENAASYNTLLTELGFDPKSRRTKFYDRKDVPVIQESLFTQPEAVQKQAVSVASSIFGDLNKFFAPAAAENAEGYAKRLLGKGEFAEDLTAKRLKWLVPDPKNREAVVNSLIRLNTLDSTNPMHATQFVAEVERLAQNLQKSSRLVDSPNNELESALSAYIDNLIENEVPLEEYPKYFNKLVSMSETLNRSSDPLIAAMRDISRQPTLLTPEITEGAQNAIEERDRIVNFLVRTANIKLGSNDLDFGDAAQAITDFIERVDEDLYKPLHGTASSISEQAPSKVRYGFTGEAAPVDDFKDTREGVLGALDTGSEGGLNRTITRTLSNKPLKSEYGTANVMAINELFRQNPQIMKDPEFLDKVRLLTPYYQFHLGPEQNIAKWTNLEPIAEEFNSKLVPQIEAVLKSEKWNNPFTHTIADESYPLYKLQETLGYLGDTPNRSPYWLELREVMKDQIENGKVAYITTEPQIKNNKMSMYTNQLVLSDPHNFNTQGVLVTPYGDSLHPYTKDLNKWNNPKYILDLQKRLFENRINVKSPTLRVGAKDVPLDKSLQELYADPWAISKFLNSDAGRKIYPGYHPKPVGVKQAAASITAETNAAENLVETAIQTAKDPEQVAKQIYTPEPQSEAINNDFREAVNKATAESATGDGPKQFKNWQNTEDVAAAEPPHDSEPPKEPPKKRFNLFEHIKGERQEIISNASGNYYTTRSEAAEHVLKQVRETIAVAHAKGTDLEDFHHKFRLAKQAYIGDIVHGQSFLDDLVASGGIRIAAFGKKDSKAAAFQKYISNAVSTINNQVGVPFLRVHTANLRNGNTVIGVTLNWDLAATPKQLTTVYKKLNGVKSDALADFTLVDPGTIKYPEIRGNEMWERLERIYNDVHTIEADLNKTLGFEYDDIPHVKNVKVADMLVADRFTQDVYNGIDVDACSDFAEQLRAQSRFSELYGSLNSARTDKRLLGDVSAFEFKGQSLFTDDLTEAVQGTLAGGAFDNKNVQDFEGLFRNKNWNIHNNGIPGPDGLKEIFMPGGSKAWANTHNLACVAPKYNDAGRLVGFQRFDMLSEKGRLTAWNNPETVLLPESMFAPLDMILKRQRRMSNKVYRWINHHITVPYKFGVLMNPGFLLGNVSDAYLKQATTMSQKYGTTMAEELTGVYRSVSDVMRLNNAFGEAYEKFVQGCDMRGITLAPSERIPSLIMGNRRTRQLLNAVVDGSVGDPDLITAVNFTNQDIGIVRMWLFLNSNQNSSVFSRNLRDMPEVAEALGKSKYQAPTNIFDRIMKGRGEYNPNDVSTWGLFMNNPVAVKMMDTSEDIEAVFRSATILNDLRHQGMPLEDLEKLFGDLDSGKFQAEVENMTMGMQEAVDAMANANFDYESSSEFMNAAATIMPFPTFFLKNLAYWLQLFVNNPQYIDNAISVQNSLWGGKDDKNDEFQAEAKGRGAIPVAPPGVLKNNKLAQHFKGIYKPTPLNSMFGALNAINDPLGDALFRLHPIISTAAIAASRNPVTKKAVTPYMQSSNVHYRPYTTNQFEKNVKYEDPNFSSINYAIHRFNPMERTLNTALRTPAKIRSGNAQLSDFLPSVFQPDFSKKKKK